MLQAENFLSIRKSRFGKGLFAIRDLPANTIVCMVSGRQLSFEETKSMKEKESHSFQISAHTYILCEPPFLYSNHSCDPNCGVNQDLQFYTLRNIKKGEELLWDYSTSMLERHWTMECHCGALECRGIIQDFDLLPLHVQEKYLRMNMVLPFIVEMLQKTNNAVFSSRA